MTEVIVKLTHEQRDRIKKAIDEEVAVLRTAPSLRLLFVQAALLY